MILSTAEVKTLLRISDTEADADIASFLPYVQGDLCAYLNNYFEDKLIYLLSSGIAFVSGDPDTITDENSEFVEAGFAAGMDVAIEGAYANTGIWEIDEVAAGTLTLTSSNELVSITADDLGLVRISKINWPRGVKMVAAQMVGYKLHNALPTDVRSKSVDNTVITYAGSGAYPRRVLDQAATYRRPRV